MLQENRALPVRDECRIGATVRLRDEGELIECIVENISEQGAKLRLPVGLTPPPEFRLLLPLFRGFCDERRVQLRWQVGTAAGVRFAPIATPD